MTAQPEALRLADALEQRGYASLTMNTRLVDREVAAELRRLHSSLHTETLAKLSALERLERAHKSEVTAKTRIIELEKALGMAVEALERSQSELRGITPTQDIKEALATARQTLGGAA